VNYRRKSLLRERPEDQPTSGFEIIYRREIGKRRPLLNGSF
jgi:hypothetical protein